MNIRRKILTGIAVAVVLVLIGLYFTESYKTVPVGAYQASPSAAVPSGNEKNRSLDRTAQLISANSQVPLYLPEAWEPFAQTDGERNFYYDVSANRDSYSVSVYSVGTAVKFNDQQDLLKNNGPLRESDFIGEVSGRKLNGSVYSVNNIIPASAGLSALIPGVNAYTANQGTSVWWTESGWNFEYDGGADAIESLKTLAGIFQGKAPQPGSSNKVLITGSSDLTFYYIWNLDGFQYIFRTRMTDYPAVLSILQSMGNMDSKVTVASLTEYLKAHDELDETAERLTTVRLVEKSADGVSYLFALLSDASHWSTRMFLLQTAGTSVTGVKYITDGDAMIFDFDLVRLTGGTYIAVYADGHTGTGNLELYPIEHPEKIAYAIPAIDNRQESQPSSAEMPDKLIQAGVLTAAGAAYEGGKLNATYEDIDRDGCTDIILEGIVKIRSGSGTGVSEHTYYCKNVWLYSVKTDTFVFSSEDSVLKLI